VALLESGGLEPNAAIQAVYDAEAIGIAGSGEFGVCRLRYFGGTTNHWAGWCTPLDDLDFQVRPWVPHSGWPISRADLDPYYDAAHRICDLGPYDYSPEGVGLSHLSWPKLDAAKAMLAFRHRSRPTRLGE
jgi:choline dehydrogenase-like flavoprotein